MKTGALALLIAATAACHIGRPEAEPGCPRGPRVVKSTDKESTTDAGSIRGTVWDAATSEAIPAAVVSVHGTPITTRTDSSGSFVLTTDAAKDSVVSLRVLALGYEYHVDPLRIWPGQGLDLNVYLAYNQICLAPLTVGRR